MHCAHMAVVRAGPVCMHAARHALPVEQQLDCDSSCEQHVNSQPAEAHTQTHPERALNKLHHSLSFASPLVK